MAMVRGRTFIGGVCALGRRTMNYSEGTGSAVDTLFPVNNNFDLFWNVIRGKCVIDYRCGTAGDGDGRKGIENVGQLRCAILRGASLPAPLAALRQFTPLGYLWKGIVYIH
jgi:hypothetical protein